MTNQENNINEKPDYSKLTKQEASALISKKLAEAYGLIRECETIADIHGEDFSFSVAYGMGGYYSPKPKEGPTEDKWGDSTFGWQASSQGC